MANGKEHRRTGQVAGGSLALYRARNQDFVAAVLETFGGYYGGSEGARLHDLLEPATNNPNHRGICHSVTLNVAAIAVGMQPLDRLLERLRALARMQVYQANLAETPPLEALVRLLFAGTAHFAAGYVSGYVGGAVSHLLLDACTNRSIPLLMKCF